MINRNSEKEIKTDIEFIDGIIEYLDKGDYDSVKRCLIDWKNELENIKKKS